MPSDQQQQHQRVSWANPADELLELRKRQVSGREPPMPATARQKLASESKVAAVYAGRSVFVTGATGFIGKALVEKLLRSCPDIGKIYILIRTKKGKSPDERLAELLNSEIFGLIKASPDLGERVLREKLVAIAGDIAEPNYGIAELDMVELAREVSIIFNSAATVRFMEPIENAQRSNIYSAEQLFKFCDQLPNLDAIVHLSTAYSLSNREMDEQMEEIFYEEPMKPRDLEMALREMRSLPKRIRRKLSPLQPEQLADTYGPIQDHPDLEPESDEKQAEMCEQFCHYAIKRARYHNTYTFTKAISERQLLDSAHAKPERYLASGRVPIAVLRPSIVGSAWTEPAPGFVDNMSGPTGAIVAFYNGLLQMMPARKNYIADFVPVDMCVNFIICAGYFLFEQKKKEQGWNVDEVTGKQVIAPDHGLYLFNYVSGHRNPMAWQILEDSVRKYSLLYPSKSLVRLPDAHFIENDGLLYEAYDYVLQKLPAQLIDLARVHLWRQKLTPRTSMVCMYERTRRMADMLAPFTQRQWRIRDTNVVALQAHLNQADKQLYPFDVATVDWRQWMDDYIIGARLFVMKEDTHDLPGARKQLAIRQNLYRLWLVVLCVALFYALFLR